MGDQPAAASKTSRNLTAEMMEQTAVLRHAGADHFDEAQFGEA